MLLLGRKRTGLIWQYFRSMEKRIGTKGLIETISFKNLSELKDTSKYDFKIVYIKKRFVNN